MELCFQPAYMRDYLTWLKKYFKKGGQFTSYIDREFMVGDVLEAVADFHLTGPYGANSREIIIPRGVSFLGGDTGHCTLYFMESGTALKASNCPHVPMFSDPEFLNLRGAKEFLEKKRKEEEEYRRWMVGLRKKKGSVRRKREGIEVEGECPECLRGMELKYKEQKRFKEADPLGYYLAQEEKLNSKEY